MSWLRASHRKRNESSREDEPSSFDQHSALTKESLRPQQSCGKLPETLASDDLAGDDSIDWCVTDDWPEFVPITSDEIETIEAFLREAIGDLLK
jgi:hypothetical protein